jgi:hypothetical protein
VMRFSIIQSVLLIRRVSLTWEIMLRAYRLKKLSTRNAKGSTCEELKQ